MKKWYGSLSAILLTALAVQLTGCASTSRTFARWTGRDKADEEVAQIDGKAEKDTAAKARSEARRPAASTASKSKAATESDDRIAAKKVDPKAEAKTPARSPSSIGSSRDRLSDDNKVASAAKTDTSQSAAPKAEVVGKVNKGETVAKTASASKSVPPKSTTTAAPKAQGSADPFAEFDIAANEDIMPPMASKSMTSPEEKPKSTVKRAGADKTFSPTVDADFEEFASKQSSGAIQEVSHRGEEDDLPAWATETAKPSSKTKSSATASNAAGTAKTKKPAVSPAATATNSPKAKATTATETAKKQTVPVKEKYASLCPEAKGEVAELVQKLDSDDMDTVKRSIHRLGRMQADAVAASPALQKLLLHRDSNVRVHAALALVRMNEVSPFVTETLILALRSPDPSVRSFSAAVLAEMGPRSSEALPALSAAMKDSDGFVRLHVAEVLIRHDDYSQAALETLLKCLRDDDENVRWLATYSLAELAPQSLEAATALERCLSDGSPKVCVGAAYALGEIGPLARSTTTSLKRCANSSDPELQAAVAYALRQVQ